MYFLYDIIDKNTQNIEIFINDSFESKKLFDLKSNDNICDHFAHSTNLLIYNDLIECYYTNFNTKDLFYITKLSYNINTESTSIIDIKNKFLGIIPYNFKFLHLQNDNLIIGGHHPETTNIYISSYYKSDGPYFKDKRFIGHPVGDFISYKHNNKYHVNGTYILNDITKNNFSYYKNNNKPIIHLKSPHIIINQNIDFDCKSSVVFNNKTKKYIYCTRSNIKSGTRFISYSSSEDLINWETFKYLDLKTDFDKDNYYYSAIFNYHGIFIGFPLYSSWEHNSYQNCGIKIIVGNSDFTNWQNIDYFKLNKELYDSIIIDVNFKNKQYDEIFEHTNHCCPKKQFIISHKFPKYSIIGIKNKETLIGTLITIPIILNDDNTLYADILENGFIEIEYINSKQKFVFNSPKPYVLKGTNLKHPQSLKISFNNAKLFAIA